MKVIFLYTITICIIFLSCDNKVDKQKSEHITSVNVDKPSIDTVLYVNKQFEFIDLDTDNYYKKYSKGDTLFIHSVYHLFTGEKIVYDLHMYNNISASIKYTLTMAQVPLVDEFQYFISDSVIVSEFFKLKVNSNKGEIYIPCFACKDGDSFKKLTDYKDLDSLMYSTFKEDSVYFLNWAKENYLEESEFVLQDTVRYEEYLPSIRAYLENYDKMSFEDFGLDTEYVSYELHIRAFDVKKQKMIEKVIINYLY